MLVRSYIVVLVLFSGLAASCYGATFSSLKNTLIITASPKHGQDRGVTVKSKLCYAPISQKDRAWRGTKDELKKDKTCQHKIVSAPYTPSGTTFTWTVQKDVPTATYFVKAYGYNSHEEEVAYGQSTNSTNTSNLFKVQAISGHHVSLDIALIYFSAFSIVSLMGFFYIEKMKMKAKATQKN